jgi:hypothetical protein
MSLVKVSRQHHPQPLSILSETVLKVALVVTGLSTTIADL